MRPVHFASRITPVSHWRSPNARKMGTLQKPIAIPTRAGSLTSRTQLHTSTSPDDARPMTRKKGMSQGTGRRASAGRTSALPHGADNAANTALGRAARRGAPTGKPPDTGAPRGEAARKAPTLPTVWVQPEIVANSSGRNHAAARLSHAISMTDAPSPTRSRPAYATPNVGASPKSAAPSPIVTPPSAIVQRGPSVSARLPATSAIAANTYG